VAVRGGALGVGDTTKKIIKNNYLFFSSVPSWGTHHPSQELEAVLGRQGTLLIRTILL
jgi:hypothetical protein